MVGSNMSMKNPVIPPGIDSGTIRVVAQCLNHYATPDPQTRIMKFQIILTYKMTVRRLVFNVKEDEKEKMICSDLGLRLT